MAEKNTKITKYCIVYNTHTLQAWTKDKGLFIVYFKMEEHNP